MIRVDLEQKRAKLGQLSLQNQIRIASKTVKIEAILLDYIPILVHRMGGFGDGLIGSCVIRAIKRLFPNSKIHSSALGDVAYVWRGMPEINSSSVLGFKGKRECIGYNLMPDCNVSYKHLDVNPVLIEKSKQAMELIRTYKDRPNTPNHLKPFCDEMRFEALDVYNYVFGTDAKISDMYLYQTEEEKQVLERLKEFSPGGYITIHDWAFNGRQTKSWFPEYWKELGNMLRTKYNVPLVQIGGAQEECLFADHDLRGKTSFGESVEILRHSKLHIDNESTPAHVCAAIKTPCVCLCGSTLKYWRHRENLNIVSDYHCQECEGFPNWYKVCKDGGSFGCMKAITPEYVFEKIEAYLERMIAGGVFS